MYKIHREFESAWYITFDKYTLQHVTGDLMKVIQTVNDVQQRKMLQEVYSQLIEPIRDIQLSEKR